MPEPHFTPTKGRPKGQESLLKQRVRLLEMETRDLQEMLSEARQKIAQLEGQNPQLALDELLKDLRRREAERLRKEQEEVEQDRRTAQREMEAEKQRQRHHRRRSGPTPQAALPVVQETVELDEPPVCEACGGSMVKMGEQFEESEDIHVLERRYVKRLIHRRKYRCQCQACIMTAPGPLRIVPGGRYSNDFILQVAADKWLDHIPLERQANIMARFGLDVASQTLFDQAAALAQLWRPLYDALGRRVLEAPVLHADETRWPFLDARKSTPWTVWTRTTPDIAHYAILPSKSKKAAEHLFAGYEGTIVVDGYQVYESLARDGPKLQLANCWAHVLRKLDDIQDSFPQPCSHILSLIEQLYRVELEVEGPFPGDEQAQRQRAALRAERSAALVEQIRHWAQTTVGLPQSALGKAVRYLLKRWKALTRFLENPLIPLDNNAAERSLRGPVVGRKVHYGSKSKRGTEVAAVLYTVFETAKLQGLEPVAYAKATTARLLETGEPLMPEDVASAL